MGIRALSVLLIALGLVALACGGENDEPAGTGSTALIGGTAVANAAPLGVVFLEHVVSATDTVPVSFATGVLVMNDTVLTAGHAVDYIYALAAGAEKPAVILNSSASRCAIRAAIRCARSLAVARRRKVAARVLIEISDSAPIARRGAGLNLGGEDAALLQVPSNFVVNGLTFTYCRALSAQKTSSLYNTTTTCYGMGFEDLPNATFGNLRKADFGALAVPA